MLGTAETVIGITTTIVPDGKHRGLYRDRHSIHAQAPGISLPIEPVLAQGGARF